MRINQTGKRLLRQSVMVQITRCPLCGKGMSAGFCYDCSTTAMYFSAENILAHWDARLADEAAHNGEREPFTGQQKYAEKP